MTAEQGNTHRAAALAALGSAVVLVILSIDIVVFGVSPRAGRPRLPRDRARRGLVRPDPHRGRAAPRDVGRDSGFGGDRRPADRRWRSPRPGSAPSGGRPGADDRRDASGLQGPRPTRAGARAPAARSSSTTPSRAAARPRNSGSPRRRGRAASSRSSCSSAPTSSSSCAARSPMEPTRWRWPGATARRPSSRWSPRRRGCPTPASRPEPATTSPSTSGSTATTSSARWTPSSPGARNGSTLPRSTARCSSTTSRSASTPRPSSARAIARRSCKRSSTRCRRPSGPTAMPPGAALERPRRRPALLRRGDPRLQQPLPARARGRLGHPAEDRRGAAGDRRRLAAGGRQAAGPAGLAGVDHRPRSRSTRRGQVAAGIDGEAVTLDAPLRFTTRPAALRVRIAAAHPGASPSAAMPEGAWETATRWRGSPSDGGGSGITRGPRPRSASCSREAKAVDGAIYAAIAASDTPTLDSAMRRLSRTADHGKLWFGRRPRWPSSAGQAVGSRLEGASSLSA